MTEEKFTLNKINNILNSTPSKMVSMHVSETEKDASMLRKDDETWEDVEGHIWERKDGLLSRTSKNFDSFQKIRDEITVPSLCPKCKKRMDTWQDKKFYRLRKMCMRCNIEFEHKLRLAGKFEEYERNIIKQNSLSWLKDAEAEVKILKESLKHEYVNEDGTIETWSSEVPPEVMKERIQTQFDTFKKEFIAKL